MTFRQSAARTAGFAALYLLATYAGRLTVMDATNLSLVWPAAGVLSVWFVVQRGSRWRWLDVLALVGITMLVNMATGSSAALAAFFVVANVVQALVFAYLAARWLPSFQSGRHGVPALSRLRELWRLIAAAGLATASGALIGPTGVWLVSGTYGWQTTVVWLTRNTVSVLLVGVAILRVGHLFYHWWLRRHEPGIGTAWWRALPVVKRLEYAALVASSLAAYCVAFGLGDGLPVAFAVISVTVWAGLRMHTTFVILHDLSFGSIAILFTLHGDGPFAMIESHAVRALIAQLFVGMVAVVGLALALSRDERDRLTTELRAQAQLMTTIVDTLSEGISVV
ncbi:MAG TPA: MASE1 domain-containing protein, partial [Actinoplanes sp.]